MPLLLQVVLDLYAIIGHLKPCCRLQFLCLPAGRPTACEQFFWRCICCSSVCLILHWNRLCVCWTKTPYFLLCFFPSLLPLFHSHQCSVSCGRGTKQREVACILLNQTRVGDEHCSHLPQPQTQKACRARSCPGWKANRWREVRLLFTHTGYTGYKHAPPNSRGHRCTTCKHSCDWTHLSNHNSVYTQMQVSLPQVQSKDVGLQKVLHLTSRCWREANRRVVTVKSVEGSPYPNLLIRPDDDLRALRVFN